MKRTPALIAGLALVVLCAAPGAQDIEKELDTLIQRALTYEGRPLRASEMPELESILIEIEERIIYLQGIGGRRPIDFLTDTLLRIESHQNKLERPRQAAHAERQKITKRIGEVRDRLTQPGSIDTNLKASLEGELERLEKELQEHIAAKAPITIYWLLVRGVTGFADGSAVDQLSKVLKRNRDSKLAHDLMFGLQGNKAPALVDLYAMVIDKCSPELAIMAAEQLGHLEQRESVDALVSAFNKHRRSAPVMHAIGNALERLTGQPHGDDAGLWADWWKGAQEVGVEKSDSGRFVKKGEAETTGAERRRPDVKVLVLTQRCPRNGSGEFDQIQDVCSANGIAYELMTKLDFNKERVPLEKYSAILISCTQYRPHCHGKDCRPGSADSFRMKNCAGPGPHEEAAHRLDEKAAARIKAYVRQGGYLFTEDWGLIELTREIFPEFVTSWPRSVNTSVDFMREQDVDVNPPSGIASHHLLRGVYQFHDVSDEDADGGTASMRVDKLLHKWHIDDQSPAMIVLDPARVAILLTSNNVADLTGTRGACAVTFFPFGTDSRFMWDAVDTAREKHGGRVLHILSHFTKQAKVEDERAIKGLLLNFIEEAAWAWDARQRRKDR